jgi:hypothetical protein
LIANGNIISYVDMVVDKPDNLRIAPHQLSPLPRWTLTIKEIGGARDNLTHGKALGPNPVSGRANDRVWAHSHVHDIKALIELRDRRYRSWNRSKQVSVYPIVRSSG